MRTENLTIYGEPASKANGRKKVKNRRTGKEMFIKSDKALKYVSDATRQLVKLSPLFEGDLSVEIHIWYATRRPDLDESVILDVMQGYVYENDRQVKEKHIFHHLDKANPRAEITVSELAK